MTTYTPTYLTTQDLQNRWHCEYSFALSVMHREGSGAIKIGRKLLITEKEVQAYERENKVRKD